MRLGPPAGFPCSNRARNSEKAAYRIEAVLSQQSLEIPNPFRQLVPVQLLPNPWPHYDCIIAVAERAAMARNGVRQARPRRRRRRRRSSPHHRRAGARSRRACRKLHVDLRRLGELHAAQTVYADRGGFAITGGDQRPNSSAAASWPNSALNRARKRRRADSSPRTRCSASVIPNRGSNAARPVAAPFCGVTGGTGRDAGAVRACSDHDRRDQNVGVQRL